VENTIAGWTLTCPEKRQLLKEVYISLDRINDPKAFKVSHAYLKQFQNESKYAQIKPEELESLDVDARRCIILAIKARDVINFEELIELNAVKKLEEGHKEVLDFLDLFTSTDAKNF